MYEHYEPSNSFVRKTIRVVIGYEQLLAISYPTPTSKYFTQLHPPYVSSYRVQ